MLGGVLAAAALAASTNFTPLATSPEATGDGPAQLAAADLTGDGRLDLAIPNADSDTITILRNRPALPGDFVEPPSSPEATGDSPTPVAAGDIDGDGDQDLVSGNGGGDTVTVLRNNGTGNFTRALVQPGAGRRLPLLARARRPRR